MTEFWEDDERWSDDELTRARVRDRQAARGVGTLSVAQYLRALDQMDELALKANPAWKPWGRRAGGND